MILQYHHIAPPEAMPRTWEPSEDWRLVHTPQGFERQLLELRRRGYRFVALSEIVEDIYECGAEDPKTVAVTFDDGWEDNFSFALPALNRLQIPATFFVTTAHLRNGAQDARKMSLAQLKELLRAGMTLGGHTRSHPDLRKLPPQAAMEEIAGCKQDLERALGVPIQFFAYPGGAFNRDVARLAKEAGYTAACSVLSPATNTRRSMFWLFRDLLTEPMNTWGDRYRLSPVARRVLCFRVKWRLKQKLDDHPICS
jgi:peptidoglycan/xylan/chitin deacetylase (PgdA/CDA1 family)